MKRQPYFRANVGVVVTDGKGQVLAFERAGHADAWQFPQGGIDAGETPQEAAFRELEEETGLTREDVVAIDEVPQWLAYEVPAPHRRGAMLGQAQRWFLFAPRPSSDTVEPRLDRARDTEFQRWRWMAFDDLIACVWAPRIPIYRSVFAYFRARLGGP
ncbi:MAG: RNA pyrophosphohydrolase [Myxococcota bacterium]